MQVRFLRLAHAGDNPLPRYESELAAGMDLRAALDAPMVIAPQARELVPTGFRIAIEAGFEGQVRARSGLALKHGIIIVNGPGTIDADYRGELKVILGNTGDAPFTINHGDRIAQLVVAPVVQAAVKEVSEMEETARGSGGFGSTGV